uniref:Uncharacterized protein n=1 Tax=Eucampia antarctica TaxID=49252 RepID=A0A7S2RYW5_9STRA|mmetsp:Transcript_28685/g.27587  ORF Transcript_28685/g.27587 Transcript_28685/m.27587 type:complete len:178 (+) Transcript_28685:95-628(+)|eukprot:CAMPEP_0197824962 /NCGR_PEP_ID=MMETSP1437-20131217/2132_1 /TAXON_ID=49252 ORGANISM="Eucampia antarctica, Strain CCMP1452" /NCGR_SAMPLE_ID=MMETSP1437 /ASSEMBLY_ACC=CAM_ASM_001096 /LENGTH=177 /DNA_ID=CAMNT_0043424783 /DNA_START=91 /DNA_END=627 /DNA_ORIENTATION=-
MMIASQLLRSSRHVASPRVVLSSTRFMSVGTVETIPGVGKGKTSTGLVGLAVDHDAVPKMIVKYGALLDRMEASDMPASAQYRINLEQICRFRIQAAQDHPDDPEKVEELCNCGQVEELVEQADNENIVLEMYLKNRWWEYVKGNTEIEYNPVNTDDHGDDIDWGADLVKNTTPDSK